MVRDDSVIGAVVSFSDITERKRAEAALKQERDFAESLIETAPVIVLVLDPEGNIIRFNSFMESLSGYSLAQVKGRSWFDTFLAEPDVPRVADVFAETKGGAQTSGKLNAIVTRDGRERLIVWYNTQLRGPGGELTAVLAIGHDVTEQKAKEAQLLQAQKMEMVGQLTGGIAHDFNNLLTVVLGNLNLLAKSIGPDCDSEVFDLIDDSLSAARDGADLTKRLLAFSRKEPLQRKRIELPELLEHFERFLRHMLGADIAVQVDVESHLDYLVCDPSQLESALLNLALNARDSMAKGGRLSLRAKGIEVDDLDPSLKPGNYVELAVIDSGEGMPPEQLARAIEPFYTTKGSKQGTGLGLSMVYGFCEQAGGGFQLASEPGVGTRATIILPLDGLGGTETMETPEGVPRAFAGTGTVLVVEDEARVRKLAARYLKELGYDVLTAKNGDTAIEALQSESAIELVFSDVLMPGEINGNDLYRWVKEQRPKVKVLLTTGLQSAELDELTNEGESPPPIALPKPYNKEQLAAAIRGAAG
jgi:PAS domain S-box-containing protein